MKGNRMDATARALSVPHRRKILQLVHDDECTVGAIAERLPISRPAVSEKRLSLTSSGQVCYQLKTPYRDGTTHVIFNPLDFLARLAALVPKPRVNLTRFHGVFAPNHRWRSQVTPAGRRRRLPAEAPEGVDRTLAERRASMTWAQRLKRVFNRSAFGSMFLFVSSVVARCG